MRIAQTEVWSDDPIERLKMELAGLIVRKPHVPKAQVHRIYSPEPNLRKHVKRSEKYHHDDNPPPED